MQVFNKESTKEKRNDRMLKNTLAVY